MQHTQLVIAFFYFGLGKMKNDFVLDRKTDNDNFRCADMHRVFYVLSGMLGSGKD